MNRSKLEKILILTEQLVNESGQTTEAVGFRRIYQESQKIYKNQTGHYFPRQEFRDLMSREIVEEEEERR